MVQHLLSREMPKAVQATMEILIRRKHGGIPDGQWQMLCSLGSNLEDFKKAGRYDDIQLMARGAHSFSGTLLNYNIEFVEETYARVRMTLMFACILLTVLGSVQLLDDRYTNL